MIEFNVSLFFFLSTARCPFCFSRIGIASIPFQIRKLFRFAIKWMNWRDKKKIIKSVREPKIWRQQLQRNDAKKVCSRDCLPIADHTNHWRLFIRAMKTQIYIYTSFSIRREIVHPIHSMDFAHMTAAAWLILILALPFLRWAAQLPTWSTSEQMNAFRQRKQVVS